MYLVREAHQNTKVSARYVRVDEGTVRIELIVAGVVVVVIVINIDSLRHQS